MSALLIARRAFTVNKSASPGPAPTNQTLPLADFFARALLSPVRFKSPDCFNMAEGRISTLALKKLFMASPLRIDKGVSASAMPFSIFLLKKIIFFIFHNLKKINCIQAQKMDFHTLHFFKDL